jgi:glycerol-3-phosphate dehydrogenase
VPALKRDLAALAEREHDLLVIGGGIHGAAIAWDAAQRGLKTALVEARDFGAGTSWNSLKTIHGGLRYLQSFDLRRLRESVAERRALLRIAPEIVRPLPFLVPVYGHGLRGREAFELALRASDFLSGDRNAGVDPARHIPKARVLSRDEVLARVPGVAADGLTGGASWCDAQAVFAERLVLGFVRAAADAGATVANDAEVAAFLRDGARVTGARVKDAAGGGELEVRARLVLNATGPGTNALLRLAGIERAPLPLLRAWNLVLRRAVVRDEAVGGSDDGRFFFLVPWRGAALLGTDYARGDSVAGPTDVERLVSTASRAFPWAGVLREDVTLVHRGLVPGSGGADGLWTRQRLTDHARDGAPGLLSAVGVKYTTARAVAEQAVDRVALQLDARVAPCRTAETPLVHARPLEGSLVERTREAVREEMARRLTDTMLRRLDLGTAGPPEAADVESVAGVMAAELGWNASRQAEETRALLETYRP